VIRIHEVIDSRPVIAERPDAAVLPPGTPAIGTVIRDLADQ